MTRSPDSKITWTKNHGMFSIGMNRPINLTERARLKESMRLHGYLKAFPLLCRRENGKLFVVDGQHRLAVAKDMGIAVCYVVMDGDIDVALLNGTQKPWSIKDFIGHHVIRGNENFLYLRDFVARHRISPTTAAGLLSGLSGSGGSPCSKIRNGTFVVDDESFAERVGELYSQLRAIRPITSDLLVRALVQVCSVPDFDSQRLIAGARSCPEMIQKYGTREGFLDMLERIYNHRRRTHYPLKINAENVARSRGGAKAKKPMAAG